MYGILAIPKTKGEEKSPELLQVKITSKITIDKNRLPVFTQWSKQGNRWHEYQCTNTQSADNRSQDSKTF